MKDLSKAAMKQEEQEQNQVEMLVIIRCIVYPTLIMYNDFSF